MLQKSESLRIFPQNGFDIVQRSRIPLEATTRGQQRAQTAEHSSVVIAYLLEGNRKTFFLKGIKRHFFIAWFSYQQDIPRTPPLGGGGVGVVPGWSK